MDSEKTDLLQKAFEIIAAGNIILCPSWGEYPVYDDLAYDVLCFDPVKMNAYGNAIRQQVKDKVVVEIGTGGRAPLALMCAEAGAKKVYAIEANPKAAEQAELLIKSKNLGHKIQVVNGYSTDVELPEPADICISEIIGNIGSSEGAVSIINSAHKFFKEKIYSIPERCVTRIAPAFLPDNLYESDLTREVLQSYVSRMYQAVGHEFPITRYAIYNFPESNIIAAPEVFEDIYFNNSPEAEMSKFVEFTISDDSKFDGFLFWVNLHVNKNNVIDTLDGASSWAPAYLKAPEMRLEKGDILTVNCIRKLSQNRINPDYFLECSLVRNDKEIESFKVESYYSKA
jgi:predicted RNA methylase